MSAFPLRFQAWYAGLLSRKHRYRRAVRRAWSPLSPWPLLTVLFAFVRRSLERDVSTSSDSVNRPRAERRTYLFPPRGSTSSRFADCFLVADFLVLFFFAIRASIARPMQRGSRRKSRGGHRARKWGRCRPQLPGFPRFDYFSAPGLSLTRRPLQSLGRNRTGPAGALSSSSAAEQGNGRIR